ncbi:MAG: hypothetical protein AB8G18_19890 [Gammaproteobacteria bacterium]
MKKLIFGTAVSMFIATPAMAQVFSVEPVTEIEIELNGEVAEFCGLTNTTGTDLVDFGELAVTPTTTNVARVSDFGMVCNSANGLILTVAAENGALLRDGTETGPGNEIPYQINPGTGVDTLPVSPGTPLQNATVFNPSKSYTYAGSEALRNGANVNIQFRTQGVQGPGFQGAPTTTVFAGDYSDTVTITLVAQ